MKTVRLGRTGLQVSELCLGTMTFGNQCDEPTSRAIMDRAFDAGVYFWDTADMYPLGGDHSTAGRTEEFIGRWIRDHGRRDRVVLATKCRAAMGPGPNQSGLSRRHVLEACEASLRRLQTDHVDVLYAHSSDPQTPIEETMDAFDTLVRQGKVRYLGASNYQAWELARALAASERGRLHRYDVLQPRYNALFREIEHDLVPLCREEGLGIVAYNPLAGGMLTGRYRRGQAAEPGTRFGLGGALGGLSAGQMYQARYWHDAQFRAVEALEAFFAKRGRSLTTASVAWVLAQPGLTGAILGASHPEQLDATLAASGFVLDEEEQRALDEAWYSIPKDPNPRTALK